MTAIKQVYCQDCKHFEMKGERYGYCKKDEFYIDMFIRASIPFDCDDFKPKKKRRKRNEDRT